MTKDSSRSGTMTGSAAFSRLDALYLEHERIFSQAESPGVEELRAFDESFRQTEYVRGLYTNRNLQKAIDKLEIGFQTYLISLPPKDTSTSTPDLTARKAHKRLERELRFLGRVAALVGPSGQPLPFTRPGDQKSKCQSAAKALRKAHNALSAVLRDELFREAGTSPKNDELLFRLEQDLPIAATHIENTKIPPLQKRVKDPVRAGTRMLINRLSDSCYRIYGYCSEEIISHLIEFDWLKPDATEREIKEIIVQALGRKLDQFNRRIPNEDYVGQGLRGRWAPATTLNPPWMQD